MLSQETRNRHKDSPLSVAQKTYLVSLLKRAGFLAAKVRGGSTSPQWRKLFSIAGSKEPVDPLRWPTADTWIDSLTMVSGHDVIRYLKNQVGDKDALKY